jgi:hypothetical protein
LKASRVPAITQQQQQQQQQQQPGEKQQQQQQEQQQDQQGAISAWEELGMLEVQTSRRKFIVPS